VLILGFLTAVGAGRAGTLPSPPAEADFFTLAEKYRPQHPPVRSSSSAADVALARHLKAVGAACYSAWWCPHCQDQREQFGKEAVEEGPFVECSTERRTQLPICRDRDVEGYPTWIINGQKYGGMRTLAELAEYSQFKEYPAEAFKPRGPEATEYIWGRQEAEEAQEQ